MATLRDYVDPVYIAPWIYAASETDYCTRPSAMRPSTGHAPHGTWQTLLWDVPPHPRGQTLLLDLPPMVEGTLQRPSPERRAMRVAYEDTAEVRDSDRRDQVNKPA